MEEKNKRRFFFFLHQHMSNCPDPALFVRHVSKEIPRGIRDVQGYDLVVNTSLAL